MRSPTPSQQFILDYLAGASPRWVSVYELRDATAPAATENVIKVQVHHLRHRCGAHIQSKRGCYGGYRMEQAA